MSSYSYLLAIISILVSIKSGELAIFCNVDNKGLVDAVFNIFDDIYLFRGQDVWVSNYLKNDGKIDPTSIKLDVRFKVNNDIKQMMTGFMVESIPSGCDSNQTKEKCLFNDYMNHTVFIFYKRSPDLKNRQIYSMLKWDPNKHAFVFDKEIGGYGYLLRANQTVVRSSWPGMVAGGYIIATLFIAERNLIVYFMTTSGQSAATDYTLVTKSLDEEWDIPVNVPTKPFPHKLIGIFRKDKNYFFINTSGVVYQFKDPLFQNYDQVEEVSQAKKFFGCSST